MVPRGGLTVHWLSYLSDNRSQSCNGVLRCKTYIINNKYNKNSNKVLTPDLYIK